MSPSIADNAGRILAFLYDVPDKQLWGKDIAEALQMEPREINDAVTILQENGFVEWQQFIGTAPYRFGYVEVTPRGRYEFERVAKTVPTSTTDNVQEHVMPPTSVALSISPPPTPVGSPYGFVDEDWELVAERKGARDRLIVVLGYQFVSTHYDSAQLAANVESMFNMNRPGFAGDSFS